MTELVIRQPYKLIVGLGNPGKKYKNTKHNIGFEVIDEILYELEVKKLESKCSSLVSPVQEIWGNHVILAKPMTFMNLSGKAVAELVSHFEVPLDSICIIYDDLNLDIGVMRIRPSGSAGGHNGVSSIIEHLDSQNFPRLRLGIGRPPDDIGWKDYVLSEFDKPDREVINNLIKKTVDAIKILVTEGIQSAMNKYNS